VKKLNLIFMIVLITILLASCSSIEDIVIEAENEAKEEFMSSPKGVNAETSGFTYYVPREMEVENKINHNIILTEGKQTFILFVNTLEKPDSKVLYETSLATDQEFIVNKTIEDNERFGFVQVLQIEKNKYEVSVGIGGVKLTTETKKRNIAKDTKKMMHIANSVRLKP
jgi:hypothetical protein